MLFACLSQENHLSDFFFLISRYRASFFKHIIYTQYSTINLSYYDSRGIIFPWYQTLFGEKKKGIAIFSDTILIISYQKISTYFDGRRIWTLACHCVSPASWANAITTRRQTSDIPPFKSEFDAWFEFGIYFQFRLSQYGDQYNLLIVFLLKLNFYISIDYFILILLLFINKLKNN